MRPSRCWRLWAGLLSALILGFVAGCDDRDLALKFNADGSSLFFHQNGSWVEYSFAKKASRGWNAPQGAEDYTPASLSPSGNRLAMVRAAQGQFVFSAIDSAGNKLAEVSRPQPAGSSYDTKFLPYFWSPTETHAVFNIGRTTWIFDLGAKKAFSVPGVKMSEFSSLWLVLPGEQGFLGTGDEGFLLIDWEGWVHNIPFDAPTKATMEGMWGKGVFLVGAPEVDEKEMTVRARWGVEWIINYQKKSVTTSFPKPNIPALEIEEGVRTSANREGAKNTLESQSFYAPVGNRGVSLLLQPEGDANFSLHLVQEKKGAQKVESLTDRMRHHSAVRYSPDGKKIALQFVETSGTKEKPTSTIRTMVIDDTGTILLDEKAATTN